MTRKKTKKSSILKSQDLQKEYETSLKPTASIVQEEVKTESSSKFFNWLLDKNPQEMDLTNYEDMDVLDEFVNLHGSSNLIYSLSGSFSGLSRERVNRMMVKVAFKYCSQMSSTLALCSHLI